MRARWLLLICGAVLLAPRARGQVFQGVTLNDSTQRPVRRFPVVLLRRYSAYEAIAARTVTDRDGMFQIAAHEAGVYRLQFGDSLTGITFGPVDTMSADSVQLRRYAVHLAPRRDLDVWREFEVDEPVRILRAVTPRYPEERRARGICGSVLAVFVVDSLGHSDMTTFRSYGSDSLFTAAVRLAVGRTTYVPARYLEHPVRQLVQHPFDFGFRPDPFPAPKSPARPNDPMQASRPAPPPPHPSCARREGPPRDF